MATNRLHLLALPIATASLALVACGGDEPTGASADDKAQFREAALKYAQCMRRHGVDMPDPSPGRGGGIELRAPGSDGEKDPAFARAEEACRKHMEDVRPPELSEEQEREFREQALEHARCMREHGIDMPDPTFGDGGKVRMRIEGDVDPRDPAFQEAQRECEKFGPRIEKGS